MPDNMQLEEYAELIERCSFKRYPELTTANGFCMYIKRKVIDEIGLFDIDTFKKGYGEENDFCYRALNRGYIHSLCDDTFVYHKGTQSFKKENMTEERSVLTEEHMELLKKKYPVYVYKTDHYMRVNPAQDIQENIRMNTRLYGKRRILFVVNEWNENMEMTAGTSLHVKDIINKLRKESACFVVCPDKNDISRIQVYIYTDNFGKLLYNIKTELGMYSQINFHDNSYYNLIDKLFDTFNFDIVHVHNFLFQTFDVVDIAKKHNAYSIVTLHDLYMACPSINMIYEGKYCEVPDEERCKKCCVENHKVNENILPLWRKKSYITLEKFDKIIVPSESTKKIYNTIYPNLNIDVIEHGVQIYNVNFKPKSAKETFDIAFVGVMEIHKGSEILKQLIKNNKDSNLRIHLFGKTSDKSLEQSSSTYINHGPYNREELPQKLIDNEIDLVCMFTMCPETYSYTLTESYMAKIPVLCFNIGAVGDRVSKDQLGWVIDKNSNAENIVEKIKNIRENKEEYNNIKSNFENYKFKTIENMQDEYCNLYKNNSNMKNAIANLTELDDMQRKADVYDFRINTMNKDAEIENLKNIINTTMEKRVKLEQRKRRIVGFLKGILGRK